MKKTISFLTALVLVVGLTCCGTSTKDAIIGEVDEFFTEAENELRDIDNPDDLMLFINGFKEDKQEFSQALDVKYQKDEHGAFKGMNAAETEDLYKLVYDRATVYNQLEYAKCGEIMEPYVARVEAAVDKLKEYYDSGKDFTDEMIDEYVNAAEELEKYGDVVPEELANRYYKADETIGIIFNLK